MTAKRQKQQRGPGFSRRQFLGRGGAVVGGVALGSTLLGSGASAFASMLGQGGGGEVGGQLSVLNWPLYLDKKSPGLFEDETGIDLKYSESLSDNNEFFAKYQRQMSQDQYPGFDIAVPSSWMAERLIGLGYVQKLPLDDIPNAANLLPQFQNPPWDPTGEYTLPWQTGMSGISYNIEVTGRELTKRRRPLRPEVQEQDRHPEGPAGDHDPAAALGGRRSRHRDLQAGRAGVRQARRRQSTRVRSAGSPPTTTRTTW